MYLLLHPPFTYLALLYAIFIVIDNAPNNGGRPYPWVKKLNFWKWMRDFFPVRLVKTAELEKGKNYIFGYHPHGEV